MEKWILIFAVVVTSLDLGSGSINGYFNLDEINDLIDDYQLQYPSLQKEIVGKTFYDREIKALRMANPHKPRILVIGAHHARELISITNIFYLLDYIMTNKSLSLRTEREILFIPLLNVDGLSAISDEFNKTNKILEIRKNIRPTGCKIEDQGIDLNRNYGYKWGYNNHGSSTDPCGEEYRGTSAFSEKETQTIRDLIDIYMFDSVISYHSYGDLYIRPTGYTHTDLSEFPKSHQNLYNDLKKILPSTFKFGTVNEVLGYNANGALMDYLYSLGIFCIEVEIGPEKYNSFHPDISKVKGILDSHLEPFLLLVQRTDSELIADVSGNGRRLVIDVRNDGIATSSNCEIHVQFEQSLDVTVLSHQLHQIEKKILKVKIPPISSEEKEVITLLVRGDIEKFNVTVNFEGGSQHKGFSGEIEIHKLGSRNNLVWIIVISVISVMALFVLLLIYTFYKSKNDTKFIELAEIQVYA
ncbi:hypothetical protein SteCoe_30934 [Stentor coeruleus]|uniref:Peptidase M14 domain-containing protein n=1 Tax=Stentor coeruleus TaxID=5963 RepID=A0A1R2B2F2_9CILI|nr:hypothetical protein SteCoe_30934 [Stentor coeruleus]